MGQKPVDVLAKRRKWQWIQPIQDFERYYGEQYHDLFNYKIYKIYSVYCNDPVRWVYALPYLGPNKKSEKQK